MLGGLGSIISSAAGALGLGGSASGAAAGLGLGPIAAALGMEAFNVGLNERSNSMQRKHEWAMWNAQNEYNKPINQMARLREAGLNPNLVYGNGATTLAAPFHSSPNQSVKIDPLAQMSAYQSLAQQDAMTQQIKAQTNKAKAEERLIAAQEANAWNSGEWNDAIYGLNYAIGMNNLMYAIDHYLPTGMMPSLDAVGASLARFPGAQISKSARMQTIKDTAKSVKEKAHKRMWHNTVYRDYNNPYRDKSVSVGFNNWENTWK